MTDVWHVSTSSPHSDHRATVDASERSIEAAAHILGMLAWQAERILGAGPYELEAVERAALEHYQPSAHRADRFSYWLTSGAAAELMGVSPARVKRMVTADRLPYVTHRSGLRLLRRHQVEVITNARGSRLLHLAQGAGPGRQRTSPEA
jgi:hypothetical protein